MKNIAQKDKLKNEIMKIFSGRFITYVVVAVVAILADIFVFKNIEYDNMEALVEICFSTLVSIAGIWVACYLLFLELLRDRYQYDIFTKNNTKNISNVFYCVIFCICFGAVVMAFKLSIISPIIFCSVSIITIVELLLKVFNAKESLMINTHVNKLEKEIENKLESGECISYDELKDLRYIFDECIIKDEYYTIQNIVEKSGNLFRTFLESSIESLPENLDESFEAILRFNCFQLDLCENIKSDMLINKIVNQQQKNLRFCIDHYQTEWYKKYLARIKQFLLYKNDDCSECEMSSALFYHMHKIIIHLIEKNQEELVFYSLKEIQEYVSYFKFANRNVQMDNFARYNYMILSECIEQEKENWFEKISEYICNFTDDYFVKDISFNTFKSYYALIFNYYCEHDKKKALKFCEDTVVAFNYDINSTEFMSFKYYCLTQLYDESKGDLNFQEEVYKLHVDILSLSMSSSKKPDKIMFPHLDVVINSDQTKDKYVAHLKTFRSLLNTCVIENEPQYFYKFLNCINEVIKKTKSKDKDLQIELLELYVWAIVRTRNLANKNFYKISFDLLEDAIKELDHNKSISEKLGEHIVSTVAGLAQSFNADNYEIINAAVELLQEISKDSAPLYFLLNNPKTMKQLYRSLFNIGTSCIENNYEEGVRLISNTIGWAIISNINHFNSNTNTNYLIDRAIDLYDISEKMETSKTTQVFIATLFTTIGSYCCKDPKLNSYRKRIIENLNIPVSIIDTAAKLRTNENNVWNDLFDNNTEKYTKVFIEEYKKQHR